jgi:hypothetical protein
MFKFIWDDGVLWAILLFVGGSYNTSVNEFKVSWLSNANFTFYYILSSNMAFIYYYCFFA